MRSVLVSLLLYFGILQAASPYKASELDIPLGLGAGAVFAFGLYRLNAMEFDANGYENYNSNNLLPWDRPYAGTWNPAADLCSQALLGYAAAPLALGLAAWHKGAINAGDFAVQALMLYEVLALQSGLNLAVRSIKLWPRPFMLSSNGGKSRNNAEAAGSFYSGHTSAMFAVAVFTGILFDDALVWGAGLSAAVLMGILRVAAGKHFPSDVIAGALMGSLIGWMVPAVHKRNIEAEQGSMHSLTPYSIGLQWRF